VVCAGQGMYYYFFSAGLSTWLNLIFSRSLNAAMQGNSGVVSSPYKIHANMMISPPIDRAIPLADIPTPAFSPALLDI